MVKPIIKYFILIICYFIWPFCIFIWFGSPSLVGMTFMLILTFIILCFYIFFDFRIREEEDFELQFFIKLYEAHLLKTDINYLRLEIDLFIIAVTLIFPNSLFTIVLFYNNYPFYGFSLIPSIVLIGFAIYSINYEYSINKKIFKRLQKDLLDLYTPESESTLLPKYVYLQNFEPIIFPQIKAILLVISFIASFIMPFVPL